MEPEEQERGTGVVAEEDFQPATPVPAPRLVDSRDRAGDDAPLSERSIGDETRGPPVLVPGGKVEQHVADGDESLSVQALRHRRPDAAQPLDGSEEAVIRRRGSPRRFGGPRARGGGAP